MTTLRLTRLRGGVLPRRRSAVALVTALLGLALAAIYAPVLRDLVVVWHDVPYDSYGFVIPVFSAYLVWDARAHLRGRVVGDAAGTALIVVGLGVLGLGLSLQSLTIEALSIPVTLAGFAFFALGRERFRAVVAPIAFLALMTPLPQGVLAAMSPPLQTLAAIVTTGVLHGLGIPAVRDGLFIHLDGRLDHLVVHVSEGCNGLRFLLAMTVMGVAFAWLSQTGRARRLAVIAIAPVLAIIGNFFRVAGTAIVAYHWGPAAASGLPHSLYGKAVYGLTLVPFVAMVLWLHRGGSHSR